MVASFVANAQLGAADHVSGSDPGVYAESDIGIPHRQVVDNRGDGLRGQEELLSLKEPVGSFVRRTVKGCFHVKLFPSAGVTDSGS